MALDSIILDVAIGVVFVYVLMSLICSAFTELIARIFAMRSNTLEEGIRNLLKDSNGKDLTENFYDHGLIKSITKEGIIGKWLNGPETKEGRKVRWGRPSYIPPRIFAIALLDIIAKEAKCTQKPETFKELRACVEKLDNEKTKEALLAIMDNSHHNLDEVKKNIENWFNDQMDRVSGWYARNVQYIVLGFALIVSLFANVDTLMIADNLEQDSTLRASIIESAVVFSNRSLPSEVSFNETKNLTDQLQIMPIGWEKEPCNFSIYGCNPSIWSNFFGWDLWGWFFKKIFGLSITIFAISLGAPFWFDLLKNLINLRSAGKPPKPGEQ
jgi:hypothetical protein